MQQIKILFTHVIIATGVLLCVFGCSKQNAGDVSKDLADNLTDSMDFTPGEKKTGTKPLEHASDPSYPQVTGFTIPDELYKGPFKVNITYSYQGDAVDIGGVVVHVVNSGKYWQIPVTVASKEFDISITGTFLADNSKVIDKQQDVEIAVIKKNGLAGNYLSKPVTPKGGSNPNPSSQELQDLIRLPDGNGAEVVDPQNITAEFQDGVPKVISLAPSKNSVGPGEEFDLIASYTGPEPKWLLFQVAGAETYMQIALKDSQVKTDSVTVRMKFDVTQSSAAEALSSETIGSNGSISRPIEEVLGLKAALMSSVGRRGNFGEAQVSLTDNPMHPDGGTDAGVDSGLKDAGLPDVGQPDSGAQDGGADSGSADVGPSGPADVKDLAAKVGNQTVTLSWTEPDDLSFNGVKIYCSPAGTGCTTKTVFKGTSESVYAGLANGTTYTFLVKSFNSVGTESTGVSVPGTPLVQWELTGDMNSAHAFGVSVLMPGDLVLTVGGTYAQDSVGRSSEIFSMDSSEWSASGDMSHDRQLFAAVLLPDGRVLATGGADSTGSNPSAELFNPADGKWGDTGPMLSIRVYHQAILLESGLALMAGGAVDNSCELYDPASAEWSFTGSTHDIREHFTLTRLSDGKILAVGGMNLANSFATAEVYDPASGQWSTVASMAGSGRFLHTATLLPDGRVLVVGGAVMQSSHLSEILDSAVIYDPTNDEWTDVSPLPWKAYGHTAVMLPNGKVLVMGGTDETQTYAKAAIFDPESGFWEVISPMNKARAGMSAVLLSNGRPIAISGATDVSMYQGNSEFYDIQGSSAPAPDATINGLPESIAVGTPGLAATVPATPGARYFWMVENGTITAGLGTNTVTITAGYNYTSPMKVHVLATSNLGIPAQKTVSVILFVAK